MKIQRVSLNKRGFTLMELMVAMAITTIIVTVLVSITSIAIDVWNRSRSELRAARQAKAMVETMSRDFESLVSRRGNESEWLFAEVDTRTDVKESGNACDLIFFTAATDRYNGNIGVKPDDKGGDVSCVGYRLFYRDPIEGGTTANQTFVLNRYLVNPDETFEKLLGEEELDTSFKASSGKDIEEVEYFVCENIFQFTLTFHVQITRAAEVLNIPVTVSGDGSDSFRLLGTGIETESPDASEEELKAGRLKAVEISLTVLTDSGVDQLRRKPSIGTDPKFLAKNAYQYSKLVQLPSM